VGKCIGKQKVPRRIKGSLVVATTREGLALSLRWFLGAACLLAFLWPFTCLPSDGFDHQFVLDCLPCC
jgi:hypothetical protein